ncbi:aminopeptidase N-like [Lutzomyia longipalpis]|uniref:aminopeptidase N-like n=1 Tax=Lutzomyia longipalpis TaxID=7200 RepID=UPI002483FA66|nr:aminopeptidase N-like [Lutzomyia longipalpis]
MFVKSFLYISVLIAWSLGSFHTTSRDLTNYQGKNEKNPISLRLINSTEPLAYEVWLETKIHEKILNYNGRVRINLRALEAAKMITIHSEKLLIRNYTLFDHFGNVVSILRMEEHESETILEFSLQESLKVDQNYILDIEFQGYLQSIPQGFCYTRYVDADGETQFMATSNLHVTNARMAFPCYDEPRYRTPFLIHIIHHSTMKAASNMPVAFITNNNDGSAMTTFENSVSMPVNLVAFAVCNHDSQKTLLEDKNVEIKFLVPSHVTDETNFARDFIIFILKKLEEYLGVGYNLPKLECVIVDDGMHLGLENWGLMVFDSKSLLYREGQTTASQKMDIAKIICHQLSHNYFGNLVGISWWNYAWMTEGFANYQEYYFTNMYLTDYPMHDLFVAEFIQRNFVEHSYLMSHSLNRYVQTRREVEEAFDYGTASKAAAVLRMCEHAIEGATFQKGLKKYVKEMSYRVAEPCDLYKNLQEAVNEDRTIPEDIKVVDFLSSWVDQPGFPLLT